MSARPAAGAPGGACGPAVPVNQLPGEGAGGRPWRTGVPAGTLGRSARTRPVGSIWAHPEPAATTAIGVRTVTVTATVPGQLRVTRTPPSHGSDSRWAAIREVFTSIMGVEPVTPVSRPTATELSGPATVTRRCRTWSSGL
jgi:hypothetical protein